jgi:hypothetical protein
MSDYPTPLKDAITRLVSETGGTIHYPFHHEWIVFDRRQVRKNRTPKTPRFRGVYIITHTACDGLVKIGISQDIYRRTEAFYYKFG